MDPVPNLEPIPRPPGHMLVGNLFDIDTAHPIEGLAELARKHGPIYRLEVPGLGSRIIASSFELVDPLCDESQFDKNVGGGLRALASGPAGRGLFTSETQDPNWRKAHNVLLPAFSMDAMRGYLPRMLDIASQLMLKWERRGEVQPPQRHAKQEPQTGHDAIAIANAHARFGKMKSLCAHLPPQHTR